MSHPAWVCGLKRANLIELPCIYVTPCVGVWIETNLRNIQFLLIESHPAWVCGLKLVQITFLVGYLVSHPAWVCGLKLFTKISL